MNFRHPPEIIIGVDLGKLRDFTAIAIIEHYTVKDGFDHVLRCDKWIWKSVIRSLERIALRTSYPRVVAHIKQIVQKLSYRGRCVVVVDATGVGQPVVDALKNAALGCELVPISITSGDHAHKEHGTWLVPKHDLMITTQMMLAMGELTIAAKAPLRGDLERELASMRIDLRTVGKGHDDLVMAVCLACWRLRTRGTIGYATEGRII